MINVESHAIVLFGINNRLITQFAHAITCLLLMKTERYPNVSTVANK